jgi:hypothetical protein
MSRFFLLRLYAAIVSKIFVVVISVATFVVVISAYVMYYLLIL